MDFRTDVGRQAQQLKSSSIMLTRRRKKSLNARTVVYSAVEKQPRVLRVVCVCYSPTKKQRGLNHDLRSSQTFDAVFLLGKTILFFSNYVFIIISLLLH